MTTIATLLALAFLIACGAWDAYVVLWLERSLPWADRLASGNTISYRIYVAARTYPAVAWLFGVLSLWIAQQADPAVVLAWWLVQGHFFFSMRDVS